MASSIRATFILLLTLTALLPGCKKNPSYYNPRTNPETAALFQNYDDKFLELLAVAEEELGKQVFRYDEIDGYLLPKSIRIEGTHYEIGYTLGTISREALLPVHRIVGEDKARLNREIRKMYARIYPQYLDFVKGVADAFGYEESELDLRQVEYLFLSRLIRQIFQYDKFRNLTAFSNENHNQCSLVAAGDRKTGEMLVGRNFDGASYRPHFVVFTDTGSAYKTLGSACYSIYHWISDGMNDQGLCAGVSTNGHPEKYNRRESYYPQEPAIQVIHLVRVALETCATVEEAVALCTSVRVWFPREVNHILFADKTGAAAVVEFDEARQAVVFRNTSPSGKNRPMVMTNTAWQEGEAYLKAHCWRYEKACADLRRGLSGEDKMKTIIESIRIHYPGARTLWTSVYNLNTLTMDIAFREEKFASYYHYTLQ